MIRVREVERQSGGVLKVVGHTGGDVPRTNVVYFPLRGASVAESYDGSVESGNFFMLVGVQVALENGVTFDFVAGDSTALGSISAHVRDAMLEVSTTSRVDKKLRGFS